VLNMLELSGIPLFAKDRTELFNIVVAGGACTCNPEPLADFIDIFMLGEGEEMICELTALYKEYKDSGKNKAEFLQAAAQIEGLYVPSLYEVSYNDDGTVSAFEPICDAPKTVKKRIVKDLDKSFYPDMFVMPYCETVFDRATTEIFRGCIRGCRFCQAGFIYRPVREKSAETVLRQSAALCENTGYEELSLLSLSTSDHSQIEPILNGLYDYAQENKISLSLPSLRIDNFSDELLKKISGIRKTGLTFAPEAGTQRLRDAINKNITEEDIFKSCKTAFMGGYTSVKLYFMLGLPTETDQDIVGIADLAQRILDLYYSLEDRPKGKSPSITISVACFIPKPFTPFQFTAQNSEEELKRKQQLLLSSLRSKKIRVNYHDSTTSYLEAVLAKGNRRLSNVIYKAFKNGAKFDGWSEYFNLQAWQDAFDECGINPKFYSEREIPADEINPWDFINIGVTKRFLISEYQKAKQGITTPNCRTECSFCGAKCYNAGICKGGEERCNK
ncbi:MAG: TIGR03960 family B12-binding radical SAM protein, partial [Oscillospiraceae bacterium]|nr:TIGR03960 family B12-binding radical SAM protein [Candidatus Equicaccousia limihippi]